MDWNCYYYLDRNHPQSAQEEKQRPKSLTVFYTFNKALNALSIQNLYYLYQLDKKKLNAALNVV